VRASKCDFVLLALMWLVFFFFTCLATFSNALQFIRTTTVNGTSNSWTVAQGMDFTVLTAIEVTAIGIFDADEPGFDGTLSARIFDRATDEVLAGPVFVSSSDRRANDDQPFVFKNVSRVRLSPGGYSIITVGSSAKDRWLQTNVAAGAGKVVPGDTGGGAILATNAVGGGNGLSASAAPSTIVTIGVLTTGASFLFNVAPPVVASPLPQIAFDDCEASGMHWTAIG
jgi:hypothetical protein